MLIANSMFMAVIVSASLYSSSVYSGRLSYSYYYEGSAIQLQAYYAICGHGAQVGLLNYTYSVDGAYTGKNGAFVGVPTAGYINENAAKCQFQDNP